MAGVREIKSRMKAVRNIRRITKTMQMIATSKFAKAQHRATATKPYSEGVYELVTELAAKAGNISHPLINGPDGGPRGPVVHLIITSDRGLCGPYNGSVLRHAARNLREASGETSVEVVGRKGVSFLKFNRFTIDTHHTQFGDKPTFEDVEKLARRYMDRFTGGEISAVYVTYMRFESTSRQSADTLQLLPLKPPVAESSDQEDSRGRVIQYEFSPAPEELLEDLLPVTVKTTLFQCFNDAIVSEHVARMVAMKSATDNAGKMGRGLQQKYNRARQAQITTELTEIISGAAALE